MDENNEHQEGLNIPVTDNNSPEPPENNSPEPAPSEEPATPESAEPEKPAEEPAPETPAEPVEEAPAESEPAPEATPAPEPTPVSEPEPLPEQPSKEDVIADIREKAKDSEVRDVMTDFNGEKTELIEQAESEPAAETGVKPVTFGENVKKKSSGLIIVLVILFVLLLTAGGIFLFAPDLISNLFGGTTSSPAPAKIALDDSEEEEEEEEETEETETEKNKTEEEDEEETEETTEEYKEYLEISEWGIKFKNPEEVVSVSYAENSEFDYMFDLYVNKESIGVSISKVPSGAGALPDTTIASYIIDGQMYVITTYTLPKTASKTASELQTTFVNYIKTEADIILTL
ncbi:hypothetical protein IJI70_02505 [Candidatus Saccharibacteria bacterium]|nr:hypothetical protein [Candidatus Saccharibacteria bacterium]